jgi:predicted enzyme related to lactoylglutathione lyase
MPPTRLKFVGTELYFDDLPGARQFYRDVLKLDISDEQAGRYAKFAGHGAGFFCLEAKGLESYRSADKAVLFFESEDLSATVSAIGNDRIVHSAVDNQGRPHWAVMHDPEGHNIVLIQAAAE